MKQYIYKFSIWLIITFLFSSCEKVIDIDLNSSDPKIVVEAEISDQSFCKVKLTQTVNFDESNNFPGVTGAIVRISDNLGNTESLNETSQGIYNGYTLQGIQGRTYSLEITYDGKIYTAISTMQSPVSIDSLFIEKFNGGPGMGGGKSICVQFKDPAGVDNYYRFIQIINNVVQNSIIIDADVLLDGNTIIRTLHSQNPNGSDLQTGDSVTVLLLSINKDAFDYFRTFNQLSGGGGGLSAASPANPLSNFSNGALGFFSVHAIKSKSIIIL